MGATLVTTKARLGNGGLRLVLVAAILLFAGALKLANANPALSQTAALSAYEASHDPGLDPMDRSWDDARQVELPLTAQAGTYIAGGTVSTARVRALHYENQLFVRVDWPDSSLDESATAVEDFADAAAIEFPAGASTAVPSICMGQAGAAVNIWHWRADSEVGPVDPADAYPSALIDAVPSEEDVFYTARAAGNPYAQVDASPVQDLVARSFGTLSPMPEQGVAGHGVHEGGRWYVVFSRPFAGVSADQASFQSGQSTDMAVAVWNGSEDERDGRKSVSSFTRLHLIAGNAADDDDNRMIALSVGVLALFSLLGIGLAVYGLRERGAR